MNTFMHGSSFFLFHFLSFSISFPKLTIFTILRLYMACKMWKIIALTWELVLFSIQLDWRAWNYKTKQKNICFESGKKDTKTSTMNEIRTVNAIYFAPVVTLTYRMKNNKSSIIGLSLEMSVLAKARAQLLNMLYISTHLSVPHGENI